MLLCITQDLVFRFSTSKMWLHSLDYSVFTLKQIPTRAKTNAFPLLFFSKQKVTKSKCQGSLQLVRHREDCSLGEDVST